MDTPAVGVDSPEQLGEGPSSYSVARGTPVRRKPIENLLALWRPPCRATALKISVAERSSARLPTQPPEGSTPVGGLALAYGAQPLGRNCHGLH